MKTNVVGWFEIPVVEMDRAKQFYQDVFQYGEYQDLSNPAIQMFAFPWVDNGAYAAGALVKSEMHHPSETGVLIYFICEDAGVQALHTAESGGVVLREKFSIGDFGFVAIIRDTEGNTIGLHSRR